MLVLVSRKIDAIYDYMFFFRVELLEVPSHLWLCMPRIVMANVELFELSGKVRLSLSSSFIGTADWTDTCSSYIESFMIFSPIWAFF